MAAKTRAEIRALVRAQLDMDEDELPDTLLDPWIEDAYERTIEIQSRWPFFEEQWDITTVADQVAYSKATLAAAHTSEYEIDQIASVLDVTSTPVKLQALSHDRAESVFGLGAGGGGVPAYWSEWGGNICLWQAPDAGRTVRVRGFRKPAWIAGDDVAVDADARLHLPIFYFVCGLAYAQQEDEVLKGDYMQEWDRAVRRAHDAIMASPQRSPIVMSGSGVRHAQSTVTLSPI